VGELELDSANILDNAGNAEISATLSGNLDGLASNMALIGNLIDGGLAIQGTAFGNVGVDGFTGDFIAETTP
jgi:hypothetical protein